MTFDERVWKSIKECQENNYVPSGFIGMITRYDSVVEASRYLINNPKATDGFTRLYEMGCLHLSVEAICQDFPDIFTEDERKKARKLLVEYRYVV